MDSWNNCKRHDGQKRYWYGHHKCREKEGVQAVGDVEDAILSSGLRVAECLDRQSWKLGEVVVLVLLNLNKNIKQLVSLFWGLNCVCICELEGSSVSPMLWWGVLREIGLADWSIPMKLSDWLACTADP